MTHGTTLKLWGGVHGYLAGFVVDRHSLAHSLLEDYIHFHSKNKEGGVVSSLPGERRRDVP